MKNRDAKYSIHHAHAGTVPHGEPMWDRPLAGMMDSPEHRMKSVRRLEKFYNLPPFTVCKLSPCVSFL